MFTRRILLICLTLAFGAIAQGQQPSNQTPDSGTSEQRIRFRRGHIQSREGRNERREFGKSRGLRELSLTEDQQHLRRTIVERHLEAIKSQRDELFKLREKRVLGSFTTEDAARAKALRQEIHASMARMHSEIETILTPEQRTKLEQIRTAREERREEMRKRSDERRERVQE
jgi:Spy/CpxP family protein refolding chaperone